MSNILLDSNLVFENLIDTSTNNNITCDLSSLTLPQRYELNKTGKAISELSARSVKVFKQRRIRFKPNLILV